MDDSPRLDDRARSLETLIEEHLSRLTERLKPEYSVADLAKEASALNDLLISYKLRDELLERLLDADTPELRRQQIRETLEAQRMLNAAGRAELARLHVKSHAIVKRSIELIGSAQRRIDKESHKNSDYALEICGFCNGFGGTSASPCPGCKDKRTMLVHQPAVKCPRCKGSGRPEPHEYATTVCLVCRGAGWAMTAANRE